MRPIAVSACRSGNNKLADNQFKFTRLRCLLLLTSQIGALLTIFFVQASLAALETKAKDNSPPTIVSVSSFFQPNNPDGATTRRLIELMREDPKIKIRQWGGISLPGGAGKASLMMAIAGGTAPDVGYSWFHIIQNEIKQQFLYPLNEWICKDYDPENPLAWDLNKNGIVDDDETCWEPWKQIPYLWRRVSSVDGMVYGIPEVAQNYVGIVFRTDLILQAGLNPNNPPKTWKELMVWAQKLCSKEPAFPGARQGSRGIALSTNGYLFIPWIQAAGEQPIVQVRVSPTDKKEYFFTVEDTAPVTPEGEDLSAQPAIFRAQFNSPAGKKAAKLYHDIMFQKWIFDPQTRNPINLTDEDIANGSVKIDNRFVDINPDDIYIGMGRVNAGNQQGNSPLELLSRGEVAMVEAFVNDLESIGTSVGLNPELLSWFAIPACDDAGGERVVQTQNHYIVAYEHLARMNKVDRDRIWKTVAALADQKTKENAVREKVLAGLASFVPPATLTAFGYEEYIKDIPAAIRRNYAEIESGDIKVYTEPWVGYWVTMDTALNTEVLSLAVVNKDFDYIEGLNSVTTKANSGIMFETPREILDNYRPTARVIMVAIVCLMGMLVIQITRTQLRASTAGYSKANANVHNRYIPYLLILPAFGLIALWKYYPLLRGAFMAFQDYRIAGESTYVGLDNFIVLALDKSFWMSLLRTCYFVILNMSLAFTAPIVLAVLLTEIPKFKILFRTLFFLPQMTSGLVIALLWKLMYNPTPQGFFNQLISYVNYLPGVKIETQTWLLDPKLAMICCVVPTVWASMGMASLIYLAALHSIPPDYYEAADLDGAGIWSKFRNITVPTILPLIIINFVGAFIGTFQNMGNIFLMTFGGPGEATTVTGLKIWIEAYNNLRFSMATSMAWVLGSLLIGFTYFQIKFLGRVEYKKAQVD